jgi:hypothetical protein
MNETECNGSAYKKETDTMNKNLLTCSRRDVG